MRKQCTRDIQAALSKKLVNRNGKLYILQEDAEAAMDEIMGKFENVYCGIDADKKGQIVFTVQSTKTDRVFAEAVVINPVQFYS